MDNDKLNSVITQVNLLLRSLMVTITLLVATIILLAAGAFDSFILADQMVIEDLDSGIVDGIHQETGLVDSPGISLVIQNCTTCHSAKLISQNRMNLAGWSSTIKWMQETQNLWDLGENEDAILKYLALNYSPKKRGEGQIWKILIGMSFSREILIIGLCAFASLRCNDPTRSAHVGINRFVIEAEELVGIMNDDSVAILDLRKPEQFEAGHLPNSVNIWRNELQNDSMPYGGVIARKEQLESVLGSKGISNGQFLAMYDDRGSCEATRLWWILNFYGYEKMAILNGGINAWQELQSVTKEVKPMHSASFSLPDAQKEESIIYLADLVNRLDSLTVIDTRTHLEFRGEKLKAGALHKGRIPGSIHADWMIALDTATNKFKPINELEMIYKELLQSKNSRIVTYCHSGVRSSHTFFVLTELLGYREVQNFDGSWLEWTYHDLPRENDPIAMQ